MGSCLPTPITSVEWASQMPRATNVAHPAIIVGSTVINSKSIMILDGRFLVPTVDKDTGEAAIMELNINDRTVNILRGRAAELTNKFIRKSKKKCPEAFADVEEETL